MANKDKYGTLIIRSDPSGAVVTIEDICKTTPAIFDLRTRTLPYDIMIEKAECQLPPPEGGGLQPGSTES